MLASPGTYLVMAQVLRGKATVESLCGAFALYAYQQTQNCQQL